MTGRLETAINRYRKISPEFNTREGANQQCYVASYRFINLLKGRGLEGEIVELTLDERQIRELKRLGHEYPSLYDGFHYVVLVEGRLIDWTARQYKSRAPYPVVLSADDFTLDFKSRKSECGFPRLVKK